MFDACFRAFALTLATLLLARAIAERAAGDLAVKIGALLRERSLEGVLRLEPEEIRGRGLGQLLGISLEIDAFEPLARGAGIAVVVGAVEVALGGAILAAGAPLYAGMRRLTRQTGLHS